MCCHCRHLNTHLHLCHLPHQLPSCHDVQVVQPHFRYIGGSALLEGQGQKIEIGSEEDRGGHYRYYRNHHV